MFSVSFFHYLFGGSFTGVDGTYEAVIVSVGVFIMYLHPFPCQGIPADDKARWPAFYCTRLFSIVNGRPPISSGGGLYYEGARLSEPELAPRNSRCDGFLEGVASYGIVDLANTKQE